ncbi:nitrate reductase molybdenum cofactor assembly chaperone [Desulfomonile tiedjei]|uniref:Respiratory nitrate reductase chaperone NarJ n=1 Tax=Desulfomonile tiedjei (strain ATCC 49306 / DSM 6799 / DCB-1) TaxID=706587 RepID=I4C293_DESTA|nr:nitrate reductase molybdenum cofactor assembly chaperone [Desulfomonile tiedjei]AFM23684.1 respiratory nitrate reductase chaperone NarJ [Desulfomonile tiedjei DSM 6799]
MREIIEKSENNRMVFRLFATLLAYPDEEFVSSVHELREAAESVCKNGVFSACKEFLTQLEHRPLISLQAEYTELFDLYPSTCLNLTFHDCGEGKDRGSALVRLNSLFKQEGYELSNSELPDFLPVILEFLSIGGPESCSLICKQYRHHICQLARRVIEKSDLYKNLFEAILMLFQEDRPLGE